MSRFRPGDMVRLVSHDPEWDLPPIGAVGTVIRSADEYGDYAVMFHGYPWKAMKESDSPLESNDWEVPGQQLAPPIAVQDLEVADAL